MTIEPGALANLDQLHAAAKEHLNEQVRWARKALTELDGDKNTVAAAYVVMVLKRERPNWATLAGRAALAIVELAAREER